jgi:hypothetical protein
MKKILNDALSFCKRNLNLSSAVRNVSRVLLMFLSLKGENNQIKSRFNSSKTNMPIYDIC